jgi:hypothetical protein
MPLLRLYAFMTWTGRTLPFLQVFNILRVNLNAGELLTNIGISTGKLNFPLAEVPF